MVRGLCLPVLAALLALAACTSDGEPIAPTGSDAEAAGSSAESTTTTAPPLIRGLAENLGLIVGQCFSAVPETTTTTTAPTTTVVSDPDAETTTTTAPPTTEPPAITTTIARPPIVAVVDCAGTRAGIVYATLCVGSLVPEEEPLDQPDELGAVACPGDPDLLWPGDRLLRRGAARECLGRFEVSYGEPYAESDIGATELVPSRGVWDRGVRTVVCTADDTPP